MRVMWPCKDGWINFIIYGGAAGRHTNQQLVDWMNEKTLAPAWLKEFDWTTFEVTKITQAEVDQLVKHWGFTTPPTVVGVDCRMRIVLASGQPDVLPTTLQSDDPDAATGYPRRLADPSDGIEALRAVLSRVSHVHAEAFHAYNPLIVHLVEDVVAAIVGYAIPASVTDAAEPRILIMVLNMDLLRQGRAALEYAVALQVAQIVLGHLGDTGKTRAQRQVEVDQLITQWGFTASATVVAFGCRSQLVLGSDGPDVLVTGVQLVADDDGEAFRPEWPS